MRRFRKKVRRFVRLYWFWVSLGLVLTKVSVEAAYIERGYKIISDNAYRIAQECSVLVSYPKMRIEGTAVNLGDANIMLPDCRIISIEELKKIERGG